MAAPVKANWMVTPFCGNFINIFFVQVGLIDADFGKLDLRVSGSYDGYRNSAHVFAYCFVFWGRGFRILDDGCLILLSWRDTFLGFVYGFKLWLHMIKEGLTATMGELVALVGGKLSGLVGDG